MQIKKPLGSLKMVEILHIDTANSRDLFKGIGVNAAEKTICACILEEHFKKVCGEYGGIVKKWDGDGGFAFFPSHITAGSSVRAAEDIISYLPTLNAQTAHIIRVGNIKRHLRIKAHRGEVFVTKNSGIMSAANPKDFDDFLKYEKKLCPEVDELFITNELYNALPVSMKNRFGQFVKSITAGSLKTKLHMLKPQPHRIQKGPKFYDRKTLGKKDWHYLREHIAAQAVNTIARNSITRGLEKYIRGQFVKEKRCPCIHSRPIFEFTIRALYNYLRTMCPDYAFSICYWLPVETRGKKYLQMYDFRYPMAKKRKIRRIPTDHPSYKVCQSFNNLEIVVTPSIRIAHNDGDWMYFDNGQQSKQRALGSAVQFPVYTTDATDQSIRQGVLSIDTNKQHYFMKEEANLLKEEFLPYLVNLGLASTFYEFEDLTFKKMNGTIS